MEEKMDWDSVRGLEEEQRMSLTSLCMRGIYSNEGCNAVLTVLIPTLHSNVTPTKPEHDYWGTPRVKPRMFTVVVHGPSDHLLIIPRQFRVR